MVIEKKGKMYNVRENKVTWSVSLLNGCVSVTFRISKSDYPTFDELRAYIIESDTF